MSVVFLLAGLAGLWLGTKWVISSAFGFSKLFKLSHTFIGLAILALCTDLPEVFVTINASIMNLKGVESSGIITGNVIGSCIAQIAIILGCAGLFLDIHLIKKVVFREGTFLLASLILFFFLGLDGEIGRVDGILMIAVYAYYYYTLIKSQKSSNDDNSDGKDYSLTVLVLFLVFGFTLLIFSSHLVIKNALLLAEDWGVAQSFVGIVLVGLGTSLPELAVSVGAALRKSPGMSLGNIVGSNIFDTLVPGGLGGIISTAKMEEGLLSFDMPYLFGVTLLVIIFLLTKRGISKIESSVLIALYLAYIALKIFYF